MPKLLLNTPRLLTLFVALFSSMGVLSAAPANGLTFKGIIDDSTPFLKNFEIEYTLADGIFDTIVSSDPNTFFIDGKHNIPANNEILTRATLVPEVVTDFKVSSWRGGLEPLNVELSIFGITQSGLYLHILDPNQPPRFTDIFSASIKAPAGLPLSACKFQACELAASYGDAYMGYPGFNMIQTPVTESESVPEPSAAIALGFVGALLLKRHRKTGSVKAVAIAPPQMNRDRTRAKTAV